ncbi:MAG TPA: hypothetical protein VG826_02680 [Pirellulales bacterium]|nr:hypothetical protein [Pirellulales bacterium]
MSEKNVNHRFDQGMREMDDASEKVKQLLRRLESCHAKLHNWPDLQMADSLDLLGHGHRPASQPLSLDACDYPGITEFYDAIAEWNQALGVAIAASQAADPDRRAKMERELQSKCRPHR